MSYCFVFTFTDILFVLSTYLVKFYNLSNDQKKKNIKYKIGNVITNYNIVYYIYIEVC